METYCSQKQHVASAGPRREVAAENLAFQLVKKEAQKGHSRLIEWREKIDSLKAQKDDLLHARVSLRAANIVSCHPFDFNFGQPASQFSHQTRVPLAYKIQRSSSSLASGLFTRQDLPVIQ